MNKFNLTEKRIALIEDLAYKQYSLTYIANKLGIDKATLSEKMKELNLDYKQMKTDGISTFKADTFAMVKDIEDPKDQVKARIDLLKHYDRSDDVASVKTSIDGSIEFTKIERVIIDTDN